MTQRSLLWKNLRRKYGRPILKLSYWKSSLRSQIFLCTSTSLVFNEEGTYVESTGRRYKIPKEQYQMIWIHLKLSLKGDLEYDIASQWYISEKCFSKFLFFFFFSLCLEWCLRCLNSVTVVFPGNFKFVYSWSSIQAWILQDVNVLHF